jgi:hypothetical protein
MYVYSHFTHNTPLRHNYPRTTNLPAPRDAVLNSLSLLFLLYQSPPASVRMASLFVGFNLLWSFINLGQFVIRCSKPPQNAHPLAKPSFSASASNALRNSSDISSCGCCNLSSTGGMCCLASNKTPFKSSKILSSTVPLIKVVATPVLPQRPVLPIR